MYRDTFLHFNKMVHTNTEDIKYISYSLLLQYIHLCAVAADAFSDNGSDDRRKWRLDAKVRIMRLKKE